MYLAYPEQFNWFIKEGKCSHIFITFWNKIIFKDIEKGIDFNIVYGVEGIFFSEWKTMIVT